MNKKIKWLALIILVTVLVLAGFSLLSDNTENKKQTQTTDISSADDGIESGRRADN